MRLLRPGAFRRWWTVESSTRRFKAARSLTRTPRALALQFLCPCSAATACSGTSNAGRTGGACFACSTSTDPCNGASHWTPSKAHSPAPAALRPLHHQQAAAAVRSGQPAKGNDIGNFRRGPSAGSPASARWPSTRRQPVQMVRSSQLSATRQSRPARLPTHARPLLLRRSGAVEVALSLAVALSAALPLPMPRAALGYALRSVRLS
mmetsp:Transcript_1744/g.6844  ORF Transcript_1744/g.6844 Transcript_1744/m.6844 type:complete len:207 (-) Transcript_1744:4763-5383(-)